MSSLTASSSSTTAPSKGKDTDSKKQTTTSRSNSLDKDKPKEKPVPTTVYELIHELYARITHDIDAVLTWEELKSPAFTFSVVKPILDRYTPTDDPPPVPAKPAANSGDAANGNDSDDEEDIDASKSLGAVLYALMANRVQFLRLADADLSYEPLQTARASFCELLAMKLLRTWPNHNDEAALTSELVRTWGPLDGAPEEVWAAISNRKEAEEDRNSALELAIVSTAKRFLSQPIIQHLVEAIYKGDLVYAPVVNKSLIPDSYVPPKKRGQKNAADVYEYNPYVAGWLDVSRLRVPKWRHWIEFGTFAALIALFATTLITRDLKQQTGVEIWFILFTFGLILNEWAAANENGWTVYIANAWNVFDLTFILIFFAYLILRIIGLSHHSSRTADLAFDVLACGACILLPRLVFFFVRSNVVVIALRGMIATYVGFMLLAAVALSGVAFALYMLGRPEFSPFAIVKLMMKIWFGGGFGLSFNQAERFHPWFGPTILVSYSALCSTFLITALMSMVSNKFATINNNAQQEHLFQRVVATVEGAKSDAVFMYIPPFNLLALLILVPMGKVASPKTVHETNVWLIKATNLPILFAISAYERSKYRLTRRSIKLAERTGVSVDKIRKPGLFDAFFGGGNELLIHAAFDLASPPDASSSVPDPETPAVKDEEDAVAPPQPQRKKTWKPSGTTVGRIFRPNVTNAEELVVSRQEWEELKEGQKRLEEMLDKVLQITAATK